jgi:Tfp pilus assembly protein PilO
MTQSVSFRITRTAEDVAQTLNALSQRLVKLEQRLESVDLQLRQQQEAQAMPVAEIERLDGVDHGCLINGCLIKGLLDQRAA